MKKVQTTSKMYKKVAIKTRIIARAVQEKDRKMRAKQIDRMELRITDCRKVVVVEVEAKVANSNKFMHTDGSKCISTERFGCFSQHSDSGRISTV